MQNTTPIRRTMPPVKLNARGTLAGANSAAKTLAASLATALAAALLPGSAAAQAGAWPTKPVRFIVPYAPGGSVEAFARQLTNKLQPRLNNQALIIETKPGAGGAIGTEFVIRAEPDGYTLLLHSGSIILDPLTRKKPTYDARRDLAPVILAANSALPVAISNAAPFKDIAGLVEYARANPGKLNYGTPGIGTSVHLLTEMFLSRANIKITHVPYKGGGPAMTALMANEIQVLFSPIVTIKPQHTAGRVRAIGMTTAARSGAWPELPSIAEAARIDYDFGAWYGLFAPLKTPVAVINQLNRETAAALEDKDLRAWLTQNGFDPVPNTAEQFRAMLVKEIEGWSSVIKAANIVVD